MLTKTITTKAPLLDRFLCAWYGIPRQLWHDECFRRQFNAIQTKVSAAYQCYAGVAFTVTLLSSYLPVTHHTWVQAFVLVSLGFLSVTHLYAYQAICQTGFDRHEVLLSDYAWECRRLKWRSTVWVVIMLAINALQIFDPGRDFVMHDYIALGVPVVSFILVGGVVLYYVARRKLIIIDPSQED